MSGKTIIVTGAGGMLGSAFPDMYQNYNIIKYNKNDLDITDYREVKKRLDTVTPDIIIHTAAYTDVDACEKNPDNAYLINSLGTQNLVNYSINKEILFVYISSTGIYGNKKKASYDEFDEVHPLTIHHKSKSEAETIIERHLNKYLIIRTGWLFGGSINHKKNFVYNRFLEAKENNEIYSNTEQIGNPTYVNELVKQIEVLIKSNQYGIFNCVNKADNVSRYDYVKHIIDKFELGTIVKPANRNVFKRIAKVSNNESAINYKLDLLNLNIMKDWQEALDEYIFILKEEVL